MIMMVIFQLNEPKTIILKPGNNLKRAVCLDRASFALLLAFLDVAGILASSITFNPYSLYMRARFNLFDTLFINRIAIITSMVV